MAALGAAMGRVADQALQGVKAAADPLIASAADAVHAGGARARIDYDLARNGGRNRHQRNGPRGGHLGKKTARKRARRARAAKRRR